MHGAKHPGSIKGALELLGTQTSAQQVPPVMTMGVGLKAATDTGVVIAGVKHVNEEYEAAGMAQGLPHTVTAVEPADSGAKPRPLSVNANPPPKPLASSDADVTCRVPEQIIHTA